MNVDLDRDGLIAMVRGCTPSYEMMDDPVVKRNGIFSASYGRWDWGDKFEGVTDEQLFDLYLRLK